MVSGQTHHIISKIQLISRDNFFKHCPGWCLNRNKSFILTYSIKIVNKLRSIFGRMDDPRRDVARLHKLNDILLIEIIAVTCGAETWNNIQEYVCAKEDFLCEIS